MDVGRKLWRDPVLFVFPDPPKIPIEPRIRRTPRAPIDVFDQLFGVAWSPHGAPCEPGLAHPPPVRTGVTRATGDPEREHDLVVRVEVQVEEIDAQARDVRRMNV